MSFESEEQRRSRVMSRVTAVQYSPVEPSDHPFATPPNSDLPIVYLEDFNSRCDICLNDFATPGTERLSQLPCSHVFHVGALI
ncbi:hypothetical protein JVU11DRAFT_2110 [Chiua virens]|nr:hypothetical protein JVU11DRAFT_2110 [Chiua virens]